MQYTRTDWKMQAEADALRREAQAAQAGPSYQARGVQQAQTGYAVAQSRAQDDQGGASYDEREKRVVYPAQLNVKFNGQFVGKGWLKQTKFGPCLTLQLEQTVPSGGKLLIVPRKAFPDSLGKT